MDVQVENGYNVHDHLKHHTVPELYQINQEARLPYAICAINLNGDLNIGNLIRSASIFGAERFILWGKKKYDKRSSVGTHNYIEIIKVKDDLSKGNKESFIRLMIHYKYYPILVETDAQYNLNDLDKIMIHLNYYKPCFVLGSESKGLPDFLKNNLPSIKINQLGVNRSLNVSVAGGILMYEVMNYLKKGNINV